MKDSADGLKWDTVALKKLPDGGIIDGANAGFQDLHWKMKIPERPPEARAPGGVMKRNLDDRLGLLRQDVVGGCGLEDDFAIVQVIFKIESEFGPVFRRRLPTALGQRAALSGEMNLQTKAGWVGPRAPDDYLRHKKELE